MVLTNNLARLIGNFFRNGHERTIRAKRNIAASFIIKGLNIAIGLALVPLTINYLDPTKYGIWITLSSIIGWFGFFDIGLGHGLRNRFAEAIALNRHELAKTYVSTTYAILSIIIGLVLLVFLIVNPFLNWNKILNAGEDLVLGNELSILALVVFTFFCLSFIFKLITTILTADQQPAKAALFDLLGKFFALIIILVLTRVSDGSLLYLGIAMSGTPVLVLILSSVWFFNGKYKGYKPSLKAVDFSKARDLLDLGIKFFLIQISAVVLYQTNNLIISHLFGPEQVTPYNIAFRYFSILTMGFAIIFSPFWSAITEAWAKREINWIRITIKKLIKIWIGLAMVAVLMLVLSNPIYRFWVGGSINISFSISALVALWTIIIAWNAIYCQFLNGIGKIWLQLVIGVFAAAVNIPLAIILGKSIGIEGVLISNIILSLLTVIIYPVQYYKLLSAKATGIWNK